MHYLLDVSKGYLKELNCQSQLLSSTINQWKFNFQRKYFNTLTSIEAHYFCKCRKNKFNELNFLLPYFKPYCTMLIKRSSDKWQGSHQRYPMQHYCDPQKITLALNWQYQSQSFNYIPFENYVSSNISSTS